MKQAKQDQGAGFLKPGGRVLVPVDFSDISLHALRWAVPLARRAGARIVLLNVAEEFPVDRWLGRELTRRTARLQMQLAVEKLERLAAEVRRGESLSIEVSARFGRPFEQIARAAAELKASLVVMATHGYTGLKQMYLGSTAEKAVRFAPCPVLVARTRVNARRQSRSAAPPVRKIILPTDFSRNSLAAFPLAAAWARELGAELRVAYVVPEHLPADVAHLGIVLATLQMAGEAGERLPRFSREHLPADLRVTTRVLTGTPARTLCEFARRERAGLIVLSSHGHTGLKHATLGSVAERVVRGAPCSVLVVRQPCD